MAVPVVTFHFNVQARVPYLCRLLRKVSGAGLTAWVRLPPDELAVLDQALWTFSQEDFIAHALVQDAQAEWSPVLLSSGESPTRQMQVLVNGLPDGLERVDGFERVVEVVGLDESDRQAARQRWRDYARAGMSPVSHDASVQGT